MIPSKIQGKPSLLSPLGGVISHVSLKGALSISLHTPSINSLHCPIGECKKNVFICFACFSGEHFGSEWTSRGSSRRETTGVLQGNLSRTQWDHSRVGPQTLKKQIGVRGSLTGYFIPVRVGPWVWPIWIVVGVVVVVVVVVVCCRRCCSSFFHHWTRE